MHYYIYKIFKKVKHSFYQSNLNDANIKIGNWKKSTRQKDWMLRLAD